jgi:hypothetical protein
MKTTWTLLVVAAAALAVLLITGCKKSSVEGASDTKLTLVKPGDISLTRGGTAEVAVRIQRQNVEGKVSVRFGDLPSGVSVVDPDKSIVGNEGIYTLQAADDAALVSGHQAMVTIKGPSGMGVAETFRVSVKDKG